MSGSLTLALSVGSDTGVSHTDNVTNDTTPTIVGTADPLSTVTLLDTNGAVLGRAIADKLGRYVITSLPLAAGPHALTVQSGGIGHMTATSAPLNIAVQTAASATVTVTPGLPPGADSVSFSVRFAQPVSAVAATSFAVGVTGSAFGTVEAVSGSGTNYTVTIDGVGGTGTIFLMSGSTPLTDLAGNVVMLNQAQSHAVADTTDPSDNVVSSSAAGVAGYGENGTPSASGRIVAFLSQDGALLLDGPAGAVQNVYVKDTETGAIALVSVGVGGNANGDAKGVLLSADGSTIAFSSFATNLVAGQSPPSPFNLYVAHLTTDPDTGAVQLTPGSISLVAPLDFDPFLGAFTLSANGHFVAFEAPDSVSEPRTAMTRFT